MKIHRSLILIAFLLCIASHAQTLSPDNLKAARKAWPEILSIADAKKVGSDGIKSRWLAENCVASVYADGTFGQQSYAKALHYYKLLAADKNMLSNKDHLNDIYLTIADYYLRGKGCDVSQNEFMAWLEKGEDSAAVRKALIIWYYYGLGGKTDYEKVLSLYDNFKWTNPDGEVEYLIGKCYRYGKGCEPNQFLADFHTILSSNLKYDPGRAINGLEKLWVGDVSEAVRLLSTETASVPALYGRARMYHDGLGTPQDIEKAHLMYEETIALSQNSSEINLGYLVDESKSVRAFFERDNPDIEGMYSPIRLISNGYIFEREDQTLLDSAKVFMALCLNQLGERDKAFKTLQQMAAGGDSFAQYQLGGLLDEDGQQQEAFASYKAAAENSKPNLDAMLRLSRMYLLGIGCNRNVQMAEKWSTSYFSQTGRSVDETIENNKRKEETLTTQQTNRDFWFREVQQEQVNNLSKVLGINIPIEDYLKKNGQRIDLCLGCYYLGELNNSDEYHGVGEIVDFGNISYLGLFKEGLYDGYGIYVDPTHGLYYGSWEKGKRNGTGVYCWKDSGSWYIGAWTEGKRDGEGLFYSEKGGYYHCFYEQGTLKQSVAMKDVDLGKDPDRAFQQAKALWKQAL